jgi:hypothetical protein
LVDTRDNLLSDGCGIDVLSVEAITQTRDTSCDLVELDTLLAAIYAGISRDLDKLERIYIPRFHTYMMAMRWEVPVDGGVDEANGERRCCCRVSMCRLR